MPALAKYSGIRLNIPIGPPNLLLSTAAILCLLETGNMQAPVLGANNSHWTVYTGVRMT